MQLRLTPAALALSFVASLAAPAQDPTDFAGARAAWERGDYPAALRSFERLLSGPEADRWFEQIALITGELYQTRELTTDGRGVRFSPGGRWVVYQTGEAPGRTVLVAVDGSRRDSVAGTDATVDDAHGRVAYLRPGPVDAPGRLVVRDLASGRETTLGDREMLVASPVFAADGSALYFIGKRRGQDGTRVWRWAGDASAPTAVTTTAEGRDDLRLLPGGRALLWNAGPDPFVPRTGRGGGRGGRGGGPPPAFVVRELGGGTERRFSGMAPSVSADGSTLAYLQREGDETLLRLTRLDAAGEPRVLVRVAGVLGAPAVSPDGGTVAYERMPREDREIFLIDADGANERRLTREIQHDLMPQWVSATTLLAVMGEGRHRRSYLYDVRSNARRRLFHNNTVRTVAPEYEWAISGDGTKVAIVAERDGDTVSPERGVYLMDLSARVTREQLLTRVRSQLATEVALREEAARRFAAVADEIRAVTGQVSKDRIYGYARDLFRFDSKHITQPGNAKAIAYLDSLYRSFGYEVELQWFDPQRPGATRTANVIATLPGTVSPDVVYVVGSHFDSVARGPGADDNSSGTTMLLETARVLAKHPLPATVKFVSFTGEEAGLLGSRHFVRELQRQGVRLAGAMNNDMMGYANDQRLDNTIRYSNPGIRDIQHGAALTFSRLITYDALYYKSTDAAAFYDAYGDIVGGFGSYPILGNPHYHQEHDVLETINFELVAENTKANAATMMMLAMSPSRINGLVAEQAGSGIRLRWTPSPEKDIREYLVQWRDAAGAERTQRTREPQATLPSLPAGTEVRVKAINQRGLDGWDWARVVVGR